ncbi:MAG: hypothetical protein JW991_00600 [Candidatus Pacebacteria bacterium]|nr:hypothetical protein [Candidatus Paceibacterota bacterium]
MHKTQRQLLRIAKTRDLSKLSLREIGKMVGINHPQKVKHHLQQLQKKGHLKLDKNLNVLETIKASKVLQPKLTNIPVFGCANCGQACAFAEDKIQGHLKVSSSLLARNRNIFALRAIGNSMNKADINGKSIEDGDFVIVDYKDRTPRNNDYVLSIIDDCANIKKFVKNTKNSQILLLSESSDENYPPIVINMNDNFMINGKVTQVIKQK